MKNIDRFLQKTHYDARKENIYATFIAPDRDSCSTNKL